MGCCGFRPRCWKLWRASHGITLLIAVYEMGFTHSITEDVRVPSKKWTKGTEVFRDARCAMVPRSMTSNTNTIQILIMLILTILILLLLLLIIVIIRLLIIILTTMTSCGFCEFSRAQPVDRTAMTSEWSQKMDSDYIYIYIYTHMYVYTCIHVYVCMSLSLSIYIYIYIHTLHYITLHYITLH